MKLVVFPIKKVVSSLPGPSTLAELATFEATTEKEIRFRWEANHRFGDQQDDVRRSLRDCVLKITSATQEPLYCILGSQPRSPQNDIQFKSRLKEEHKGSVTYTSYIWNNVNSFEDTSRKVEIGHCKLVKVNREGVVLLEKKEDGSWVSSFGREVLLSVNLNKSKVLIVLKDGDPSSLVTRMNNTSNKHRKQKSRALNVRKRTCGRRLLEKLREQRRL